MWTTYWWEIIDEDSPLCGEDFFTELEDSNEAVHREYAEQLFPDEQLRCLGRV